jgi:hypothetical protein
LDGAARIPLGASRKAVSRDVDRVLGQRHFRVALFAGDATTKGTTWLFMSKLAIIVVGVALLMAMRRTVFGRGESGVVETPVGRALAAASLVVWFAAIVTGRYMAYV